MTESLFFQDLAMLMTVAGIVAVIFARFGWPKVLGYILAGIVMNEYTWGGSFLSDVATTRTVGQLGVVFLMFGMGLSFSARDMRKIRFVALPAAILDTVVMIWLGYTVGVRLFGWGQLPSLFLGVAICDSATTLLAKVLDEVGWADRPFAKYVLGTSVCEDIICVGAIAVATGFATGGGLSAGAFFASLGSLAVFFLAVLVFGMILVPRLLRSVARREDGESLLLTLLGCCFLVSFWAYKLNYSLALGAFLVGLMGASSDVRSKIGQLVDPLKTMFSAVFFVSIGLLVDPMALWHHLPEILLLSAVVIVGKTFNNTLASLLTGVDIKSSIQNGFSLAQIGEFAFMVAILYAGIVEDASVPMFQIAIGVSLLTTLLNPAMIRFSDRVGDWAERNTPERLKSRLQSYWMLLNKLRSSEDTPALQLIRVAAIKLGIYAVLLLFVSAGGYLLPKYDFSRFSSAFEKYDVWISFVAVNVFAIALLPLVLSAARVIGDEVALLMTGEGNDRWQVAFRYVLRLVIVVSIVVLLFLEWTMITVSVPTLPGHLQWLTVGLVLLIGLIGWKFFARTGLLATRRFMEALTAEERREGMVRTTTVTVPEGAIHRLLLDSDSPAIGESVVSLNIRAKTGASVVSVFRNGNITRNIGPEWEFMAGDVLVALGDPAQIAALKDLLGVTQ